MLRKALFALAAGLLLATFPRTLAAGIGRWSPSGPEGGSIRSLAVDPARPATVYAATGAGVFKSVDSGASWYAANLGLASGVRRIVIDPIAPDMLYAIAGNKVYKTANGGGSWISASAGLPEDAFSSLSVLAIDPLTPTTLYAATDRGAVYQTNDGGRQWQKLSNVGVPSRPVTDFVIDPKTPTTLYASISTFEGPEPI